MAIIQIDDLLFKIENNEWTSLDEKEKGNWFLDVLNLLRPIGGPPTSAPQPDFELAELAVKNYGGRIVSADLLPRLKEPFLM